jgi:hypothetical protein
MDDDDDDDDDDVKNQQSSSWDKSIYEKTRHYMNEQECPS